jgi:bifunctional non-homologous end joining protein LigD
MVYYAFDLLYLDGYDLRPARLMDRKAVLAHLLAQDAAEVAPVLYSQHF